MRMSRVQPLGVWGWALRKSKCLRTRGRVEGTCCGRKDVDGTWLPSSPGRYRTGREHTEYTHEALLLKFVHEAAPLPSAFSPSCMPQASLPHRSLPPFTKNISQVYPELPIKYPRCFSCILTSLLDLHSMSSNVHIHMANYYNINILSSCRGACGSPSPPDKVRENHFILPSLKIVFRPSDPDPHTGFKD